MPARKMSASTTSVGVGTAVMMPCRPLLLNYKYTMKGNVKAIVIITYVDRDTKTSVDCPRTKMEYAYGHQSRIPVHPGPETAQKALKKHGEQSMVLRPNIL